MCALLKSFKIFFISTALFQSSGTVYKDKQKTVAVSYSLKSSIHSIDSEITVVKDPSYRACFASINPDYTLYTPKTQIKVKVFNKKAKLPTPTVNFSIKKSILHQGRPTRRYTISEQIKKHYLKRSNHSKPVSHSNSSSASSSNHSSPNLSPRTAPPVSRPAPPSGTDKQGLKK
jgi:hypothetical protein